MYSRTEFFRYRNPTPASEAEFEAGLLVGYQGNESGLWQKTLHVRVDGDDTTVALVSRANWREWFTPCTGPSTLEHYSTAEVVKSWVFHDHLMPCIRFTAEPWSADHFSRQRGGVDFEIGTEGFPIQEVIRMLGALQFASIHAVRALVPKWQTRFWRVKAEEENQPVQPIVIKEHPSIRNRFSGL